MNFTIFLFIFKISSPNETSQFILILQPCLERSSAHLTVVTDCTVSISARSRNKDGDVGKRRATEIHIIAAE